MSVDTMNKLRSVLWQEGNGLDLKVDYADNTFAKGCSNLKNLSLQCINVTDKALVVVESLCHCQFWNMHILKLMVAAILAHAVLKASEDLACIKFDIEVKMAMLIMLSLCLIAYINASSNGDEYLVFDKAERAVCTSVDEAKVVELDFLYPSEGIHHRWESGYRITSMATTHDQAVTSRLADSIYR
ncbi:hypothetical protein Tco_0449966 [Tanacetum coccineum]